MAGDYVFMNGKRFSRGDAERSRLSLLRVKQHSDVLGDRKTIRRHDPTDNRAMPATETSQPVRQARVTISSVASPIARYSSCRGFAVVKAGANKKLGIQNETGCNVAAV